jgi:hypothetical protein
LSLADDVAAHGWCVPLRHRRRTQTACKLAPALVLRHLRQQGAADKTKGAESRAAPGTRQTVPCLTIYEFW